MSGKKMRWVGTVSLLILMSLFGDSSRAFVIIEREIDPPRGRTPARGQYLEVKQHDVTIDIQNAVARVKTDEVFHNPTGARIEGTYLFPVPAESGIKDFSMEINGKEVKGELLDRGEARQIYESIVRTLRDPALLEYAGHGLVRASIFPIEPHADVRVKLTYLAPVDRSGGMDKFRFPLSGDDVGARPVGSTHVRATVRSDGKLRTVYVPEYDVKVTSISPDKSEIRLDLENARLGRDFSIYFSADEGADIRADLLVYRADAEYGMLALSIPQRRAAEPKDLAIVVDVSGSMSGDKMVSAKNSLRFMLDHLNPKDRYTLIAFSGMARSVWTGLRPADESSSREARRFVDEIEAEGGTNLHEGLKAAMDALKESSGRPKFVLLLTDGKPTIGPREQPDFEKLAESAGPFVFTVGIGADVNPVLLDMLTRRTNSQGILLRENEDIEIKISDLYRSFSAPLMHEVSIDWKGVELEDVYPKPPKALFSGSRVLLFGKIRRGSGPATLTVKGREGDEEIRSYVRVPAKSLESKSENDFIPTLWARKKVAHLLEQIRVEGEDPAIVETVRTLGTRFGIVTPYTSFLVKEPGDVVMEASAGLGGVRRRAMSMNRMPSPTTARPSGAPAQSPSAKSAPPARYEVESRLEEFETSRELKKSKDAVSLDAGESVDEEAQGFLYVGYSKTNGTVTNGAAVRRAGDKTFFLKDGVWTDAALLDKTEIKPDRTVTFGGKDYYDLIFSEAALAKYLSVGERVVVEFDGKIIRVEPEEK